VLQIQQKAVVDGRLRLRCRHLTTSTKQRCMTSTGAATCRTGQNIHVVFHSGLFPFLYQNMTSSTYRKYITHDSAVQGPSTSKVNMLRKFGEIRMKNG